LGIPVLTTIELADSFVKTLEWLKTNKPTVEPIQPYDKIE
jgi:carbamoyl-phosphate synthase large subunit